MLPVLFDYFKNNDLVGLSKICVVYFLGIRRAWPRYWENEKTLKNCLFGKTNGVAVMFKVLHDLIILSGGAERIDESEVEKFWKNAPEERIARPPAGGGRKYQKEWYEAIMEQVLGPEFRSGIAEGIERERERLQVAGGLF